MKKVAIKLDGTREQFFKAQGYLLFLGAVGPYVQMPNDLEYILMDQFGIIGVTNTEIIPDDYDVIDPFSVPNNGVSKVSHGKTFHRKMMCFDDDPFNPIIDEVFGIFPYRKIEYKVIGSCNVWKNAKEIDDQPIELDQLKAENEMLKEKINRLKNLVNEEM